MSVLDLAEGPPPFPLSRPEGHVWPGVAGLVSEPRRLWWSPETLDAVRDPPLTDYTCLAEVVSVVGFYTKNVNR